MGPTRALVTLRRPDGTLVYVNEQRLAADFLRNLLELPSESIKYDVSDRTECVSEALRLQHAIGSVLRRPFHCLGTALAAARQIQRNSNAAKHEWGELVDSPDKANNSDDTTNGGNTTDDPDFGGDPGEQADSNKGGGGSDKSSGDLNKGSGDSGKGGERNESNDSFSSGGSDKSGGDLNKSSDSFSSGGSDKSGGPFSSGGSNKGGDDLSQGAGYSDKGGDGNKSSDSFSSGGSDKSGDLHKGEAPNKGGYSNSNLNSDVDNIVKGELERMELQVKRFQTEITSDLARLGDQLEEGRANFSKGIKDICDIFPRVSS